MSRKVVYSVVLVVVIMGVLGVAFDVQMVEAPYLVIYIKADGSIDPSTPNIESLNNVTYTFKADMNASIVVQRSNITIDGKGYTLGMDYLESTIGFNLTSVSNVTIKNMEIRGFEYGIYLYVSSNNTISGNNITNNDVGIELDEFPNNRIYHNNFIDNTRQVRIEPIGYANFWDDGFEGNYWSNYTGVDSDQDGRGDSSHVVDVNNQDNHPLMGPISFFNAGTWGEVSYFVHIISNSTVSDFHFNQSGKSVSFNVNGSDGTIGFYRVGIPKNLLYSSDIMYWIVRLNGTNIPFGRQETDNYTYTFFMYDQSTQNIQIIGTKVIPEFQSFLLLPLFMITTLLAVIVFGREYAR